MNLSERTTSGGGAAVRAINLGAELPFHVGHARLDPASREASFDGITERLQPQNLKVLIALARKKASVVSRDELIILCWDGRFVGDDVINRAISTLRQFAQRAGGFEIETIPRAGYRLLEAGNPRRALRGSFLALAVIVAAAIAITLLIRPHVTPREPQTLTLALLPSATDSDDPATRQLAFAIRDSLAHTLSQSRFEVKQLDSKPAPGEHPADFLMSVNVSRSPDTVIAAVRMEEAVHHVIVYSHRFEARQDRSQMLPDEIGPQVAASLSWTVPVLLLDRRHPSDPAVLASIFKQRETNPARRIPDEDLLTIQEYETERHLAQSAPDSLVVQAVLAFDATYVLALLPTGERAEALAVGRRAAARAHELAPDSADSFLAWCVLHSSVRMIECEDQIRAGMRVDPDTPFGEWFLAELLKDTGRFDEALGMAKRSLARDQYFPGKIALELQMLEANGDSAEADALYRRAARWSPNVGDFVWSRISGVIDRGDSEALEKFEQEIGPANWPPDYQPLSPVAETAKNNSVAATKKVCTVPRAYSLKNILCMLTLARLGDLDDAFAMADWLYPQRVGRTHADEDRVWLDLLYLNNTEYLTGPGAAPMRRDRRYLALAQRVGLLAYWRTGRLPDFCRAARPEPICSQIAQRN